VLYREAHPLIEDIHEACALGEMRRTKPRCSATWWWSDCYSTASCTTVTC
jgi:hypothetical protein